MTVGAAIGAVVFFVLLGVVGYLLWAALRNPRKGVVLACARCDLDLNGSGSFVGERGGMFHYWCRRCGLRSAVHPDGLVFVRRK